MATAHYFTAAGQGISDPSRIHAIVWTGATAAADTCILKHRNGEFIWEGRATGANTYLGINFSADDPLSAPNGFEVSSISAGRVYVYLES